MATIFNNLMSGNVLTQQKKTAASLSQSIERLSSGMRINSAKDDAAGQAIANRMSATLRANDVASRSMNDGVSLSQTAEGALSEVTDLLTRAKSLAVQSATGTLDASDRAAISAEFSEIKAQIDTIPQGQRFSANIRWRPRHPRHHPRRSSVIFRLSTSAFRCRASNTPLLPDWCRWPIFPLAQLTLR